MTKGPFIIRPQPCNISLTVTASERFLKWKSGQFRVLHTLNLTLETTIDLSIRVTVNDG